jgi:hypothetical protein
MIQKNYHFSFLIYFFIFKDNQINGYGIIEFQEQNYYQGEIKLERMEGFSEFF